MIRLFDPELAAYVRATLQGAEILSMSSVAAPVLARETLRALGAAAVNPEVVARAVRRRKRLAGALAAAAGSRARWARR